MNNKILVTGVTGTTGKAVWEALVSQQANVRGMVRNLDKTADMAVPEFAEIVKGDLSDSVSLIKALEGIDTAYLNIVPNPDALQQIDNFINAARAAGVKHIVKLSGLNATNSSKSAIIRLHALADQKVIDSGIGYTILRANSFYQNFLSQLQGMLTNGYLYMPLGTASQSFIDVKDIADVAAKCLTVPSPDNKIYELTGPESLNIDDVAATFSKALGKEITYVPISNDTFKENLCEMGMPEAAANNVAELFAVFATGIYAKTTNDVEKVLFRRANSLEDFSRRIAV